jgi:hypothetical protein
VYRSKRQINQIKVVKQNIIHINGRGYNALTGEPLGRPAAQPAKKAAVRQAAKHSKPHTPTASHTLMRHAVKKPQPGLKRHLKAQIPADVSAKPAMVLTSTDVVKLDPKRLQHARQVKRSRLVSHFSATGPSLTPRAHAAMPQPAPHHQLAALHSTPKGRPTTTAQLLEHALQRATSHQQPPLKPKRRAKRRAAIGGAASLVIALITLIAVQNLPNAQLQVASAQAGFNASLPEYKPAGFSQQQLKYGPGVVSAQFRNGDDRSYTITQKASPWNSLSLRDSFVAAQGKPYQTVAAGGRTVYLYGQHNATWVSGGVWYVVQANGSLSDRQLIRLAGSS